MSKNQGSRIDVYTLCWNEERTLPYFLRHYSQFAQRIVIFDNLSTDASCDIANSHPKVKLRHFGSSHQRCGESERLALRNEMWFDSRQRADWVIVVDCDEFLWHPNLLHYLSHCQQQHVTIPRTIGYEMIAKRFPETDDQIYSEVRRGLRANHMDKWVIFDPNAIDTMHYSPGCHRASPSGRIVVDEIPELRLLHFKHIDLKYVLTRYRELTKRRTDEDARMGWNYHYLWSDGMLADWHYHALEQAVDVLDAGEDDGVRCNQVNALHIPSCDHDVADVNR